MGRSLLEQRIIEEVRKCIPSVRKHIEENTFDQRYVIFPCYVDGCFDQLEYDTEEERFTRISYLKGKSGTGVSIEGDEFSAHFGFEDIEHKEIDLTGIEL